MTATAGRLPWGPVVATIRSMKTSRRLLVVLAGACVSIVSTVATAAAQTPVDPSTTPVENTGGWVFSMAQLLTLLGRGHRAVPDRDVHAVRAAVREGRGRPQGRARRSRAPGQSLPRRDVDISQAAPVVVAPPAVPVPRPASRRRSRSRAPPQPHPPQRPRPPRRGARSRGRRAARQPRARPPRRCGRRTGRGAAARRPGRRRAEVTLDQEVFDEKLAELLDEGNRPSRRRGPGAARRHDRRAEEGRRGLVPPRRRWTPPTPSTGRWVRTRPAWPTGTPPLESAAASPARDLRAPRSSARGCARTSPSSCPRAEGLIAELHRPEVRGLPLARVGDGARRMDPREPQRACSACSSRSPSGSSPRDRRAPSSAARRSARRSACCSATSRERCSASTTCSCRPTTRGCCTSSGPNIVEVERRFALAAAGLPAVDRDPRGDPPRAVRRRAVAARATSPDRSTRTSTASSSIRRE